MPYCDECGEGLKVGDKFCAKCGARVYTDAVRTTKTPEPVRTLEREAPKRIDIKAGSRVKRIDVLRERASAARHNIWISVAVFVIGILMLGVGFYIFNSPPHVDIQTLEYVSYAKLGEAIMGFGGLVLIGGIIGGLVHSLEHGSIMREIEELNQG